MCMLFIHLSVDGHLGDFHLLAIVTDAAVNIDVQISESLSTLLGMSPQVKLLGHVIILLSPVFPGGLLLQEGEGAGLLVPRQTPGGLSARCNQPVSRVH